MLSKIGLMRFPNPGEKLKSQLILALVIEPIM